MIRLKNILTEQHMDFDSSMKSNDSEAPQDKVIDIKGSEPYYTVIYRHEGKNYKIEFEDYELIDRVDEYGWTGVIMGVDQHGGEWVCYANAVALGGGDYDWDIDWDQISYEGKPKPKTDNRNIDIDEKEDLIFNLWDKIIDNDRQGIEKGISDNGVKFDFDTSVVDKAEFKEFRKELETMLGAWRHKVYPGSKDLVVIELYENKMKLKDLIPEQIRNNIDSEDKDFDIIANHVNYEGKYLSSIPFDDDQVMSRDFVEETIQFILDKIESGNLRDPETGEYQYDVDRLIGNIAFDCTIPIQQGLEIDLRIEYDENADIVSIDFQDADIADKFGITDEDIDKKLS